MNAFNCTIEAHGRTFDGRARIEREEIVFEGGADSPGDALAVSLADVMDLRLLNYRLHVHLREGKVVVSKLGYQTEDFFERLWDAYAAMSERALFVESPLLMRCEGDYAYQEEDAQASSIARLALFDDCLCIVPHDVGARRVPLCFAEELERQGFALSLRLDTGERYRVARLGPNTDPLFQQLAAAREQARTAWQEAHRALERELSARLGSAAEAYDAFRLLGVDVSCGLFSAEDDAFWFVAAGDDRAAVELVSSEQTATYLYRFDVGHKAFVASLRHAMEAVKTHRKMIFMPAEELETQPLYRMAVDRSAHVRFLRACNAGRIIHTAAWPDKLAAFFA